MKSAERMWQELGWITAAFLVAQVLYAYFIEHSVSESALQNLPDLLHPSKDKILSTMLFVFLIAWPLAISAAFLAFQNEKSELSLISIPWAIALPFLFHALLVDNKDFEWKGSLPVVTFNILTFYFSHYKPPLFFASVLYGGWAGKQLGQLSMLDRSSKAPS